MQESVRILITGTDLVGISSYVKLLQFEGHELFTAFNGADLLDLLRLHNFKFDLIITEVRMQGLSSYDLSDFIAMNSSSDIPVIGIADLPRDEELLMNSGESFTIIMEKGFTADELINAVSSIVHIDHSYSDGMSEQQIHNRAEQLKDTRTIPMKQSDFIDSASNFVKNTGHKDLMDKFKDM